MYDNRSIEKTWDDFVSILINTRLGTKDHFTYETECM
jgi:hypothetical protein